MENERPHREKQHAEVGRPRVHLQVSGRRDFGHQGQMLARLFVCVCVCCEVRDESVGWSCALSTVHGLVRNRYDLCYK